MEFKSFRAFSCVAALVTVAVLAKITHDGEIEIARENAILARENATLARARLSISALPSPTPGVVHLGGSSAVSIMPVASYTTWGGECSTVSSWSVAAIWTGPSVTRYECMIRHDGTIEWAGLDPSDVAAVNSAAKRLKENGSGFDGVLRALARLWRLEHPEGKR